MNVMSSEMFIWIISCVFVMRVVLRGENCSLMMREELLRTLNQNVPTAENFLERTRD